MIDTKKLRRIGTEEKTNIETSRWIQGLRISDHDSEPEKGHIFGNILGSMSDITSDIVEPNFDQSSHFDVCEAALQEATRYRQRAEIHFYSASDVIS